VETVAAYRLLQVAQGASPKEVQAAYRKMALRYHPDRVPEGPEREAATRKFIAVRDAYEAIREGGFAAVSSDDILSEAGLADVSMGMTPAGRSFYQENKREDEEMSTAEKLGIGFRIDLEALSLWVVIIPSCAIAVVLFFRWLFRTLSGG
jgi:hypothetical protein